MTAARVGLVLFNDQTRLVRVCYNVRIDKEIHMGGDASTESTQITIDDILFSMAYARFSKEMRERLIENDAAGYAVEQDLGY